MNRVEDIPPPRHKSPLRKMGKGYSQRWPILWLIGSMYLFVKNDKKGTADIGEMDEKVCWDCGVDVKL
ncbi:hypothetical protein ANCDUO_20694 [Ancylostoma duodenale]|uniref:Uncharacterized protein n=1 Tax=Ancylostoma duodenale TaxID=51022 RepID=A0A0C2CHE3_9BILA|nr:hypothetical protein ANCDUO_20694 [Ancylostoma duodenale]